MPHRLEGFATGRARRPARHRLHRDAAQRLPPTQTRSFTSTAAAEASSLVTRAMGGSPGEPDRWRFASAAWAVSASFHSAARSGLRHLPLRGFARPLSAPRPRPPETRDHGHPRHRCVSHPDHHDARLPRLAPVVRSCAKTARPLTPKTPLPHTSSTWHRPRRRPVAAFRARGLDVPCETCAHYLTLTDKLRSVGRGLRVRPRPLVRERRDLWEQSLGNVCVRTSTTRLPPNIRPARTSSWRWADHGRPVPLT